MIYRHPDYDAAVSLTKRGNLLQLDFLAKGRSQKRKGGKVVGYTTRNPDRRKLVEHTLAALDDVVGLVCLGSQGGKGGGEHRDHDLCASRGAYSRAGNYRWRLFVGLFNHNNASQPDSWWAQKLGLAPATHKPVATTWPSELTSEDAG